MADTIASVSVVTVRAPLPVTISFGPWVMKHREFALCRLRTEAGLEGFAFVYTRDGPIAAIVRRNIAPMYVGQEYGDPSALHWQAAWSNNAILPSGIGLRALSLVDLAAWDLAARAAGQSITAYLGGERRPMPVTAIIGYPPTLTPAEVDGPGRGAARGGLATVQAADRRDARRDPRAPARGPLRRSAPTAGSGWTATGSSRTRRTRSSSPGRSRTSASAGSKTSFRRATRGSSPRFAAARRCPIAMGDEQGGSYHPESILAHDAVDVERIDVSTYGGITRLRDTIEQIEERGIPFAPHMFPHTHSQVFSALGHDVPIEWGVPGTGVDQFSDALRAARRQGRPDGSAPGGARLRTALQCDVDGRADRRGRRRTTAGVADTRGGRDVSAHAPDRVGWYRRMVEIRLFEEKVQELFMSGLIQGTTHLCQGQEAVPVGAIGAMGDDDQLAAPPRVVGLRDDLLIPYGPPLEDARIPSVDAIASDCRALVHG